jgi:hypothetical protein
LEGFKIDHVSTCDLLDAPLCNGISCINPMLPLRKTRPCVRPAIFTKWDQILTMFHSAAYTSYPLNRRKSYHYTRYIRDILLRECHYKIYYWHNTRQANAKQALRMDFKMAFLNFQGKCYVSKYPNILHDRHLGLFRNIHGTDG